MSCTGEGFLGTERRPGAQVFGGDKGKTRRVHNLQADVAALEAALEAAKAEYNRVLDRNLKVSLGPRQSQPVHAAHPARPLRSSSTLGTASWRQVISDHRADNCLLYIAPRACDTPCCKLVRALYGATASPAPPTKVLARQCACICALTCVLVLRRRCSAGRRTGRRTLARC